ncbi:hypothetical protein BT96DRAFT_71754 [Gymnopus androsaceus JB14]|uniref:Uncharacterized protein n=1 Tax=Gymnopus androsaceus JB14 TaxID=1447944 RepID=A0A6A4GD48_9AGAR|nr:hypothetical protein BT96DRAFT_71754 [Gymnopus androsaceus JB14]
MNCALQLLQKICCLLRPAEKLPTSGIRLHVDLCLSHSEGDDKVSQNSDQRSIN